MLRIHVASKLLSRIYMILKILKIIKNNQQKVLFSKKWIILNFQKNGIYMNEPCQVYTCTQFQVDILKNVRVLAFRSSKTAIFTLFPAISAFFPIFNIFPSSVIQNVF